MRRIARWTGYVAGWIRARNRWGWWRDRRELGRLRAELEYMRCGVADEVLRLRSGAVMDPPVTRERNFTADGLEAVLRGEDHHPNCLALKGHECSCFRTGKR